MNPKKVSLAAELAAISEVIESARLVAELLVDDAMLDDETSARAPRLMLSVLDLAVARLRVLRKVVVGEVDVGIIASRTNLAYPRRKGDDPDVVLAQKNRR